MENLNKMLSDALGGVGVDVQSVTEGDRHKEITVSLRFSDVQTAEKGVSFGKAMTMLSGSVASEFEKISITTDSTHEYHEKKLDRTVLKDVLYMPFETDDTIALEDYDNMVKQQVSRTVALTFVAPFTRGLREFSLTQNDPHKKLLNFGLAYVLRGLSMATLSLKKIELVGVGLGNNNNLYKDITNTSFFEYFVTNVLTKNMCLEELDLTDNALNPQHLSKMLIAIEDNPHSRLTVVDLSNNPLLGRTPTLRMNALSKIKFVPFTQAKTPQTHKYPAIFWSHMQDWVTCAVVKPLAEWLYSQRENTYRHFFNDACRFLTMWPEHATPVAFFDKMEEKHGFYSNAHPDAILTTQTDIVYNGTLICNIKAVCARSNDNMSMYLRKGNRIIHGTRSLFLFDIAMNKDQKEFKLIDVENALERHVYANDGAQMMLVQGLSFESEKKKTNADTN